MAQTFQKQPQELLFYIVVEVQVGQCKHPGDVTNRPVVGPATAERFQEALQDTESPGLQVRNQCLLWALKFMNWTYFGQFGAPGSASSCPICVLEAPSRSTWSPRATEDGFGRLLTANRPVSKLLQLLYHCNKGPEQTGFGPQPYGSFQEVGSLI